MQQVELDDVIVRVMKCSCLPSGRGCAAGGGTGYKSNEICYNCMSNEIVIFSEGVCKIVECVVYS